MNQIQIAVAESDRDIARCHKVMLELRSEIGTTEEFLERVHRQRTEGYRLAFLQAEDEVRAVAGYRVFGLLHSGRTLYLDDLVTREADRSRGFGGQIFDWLVAEARREKCEAFSLDSAVHRFAAHRFYLLKRMQIAAHHFTLVLE